MEENARHFQNSVAVGMDYLKEVGVQVQRALANFGKFIVYFSFAVI